MYKDKKIGVVVPAYNEERFIASVINDMPDFVDMVYPVNDASTDKTTDIIQDLIKQRNGIKLINRNERGGVGAAIISGHKEALKDGMDVIAVMAGDAQMPPAVLHKILNPIVENQADYCKGDRLSLPEFRKEVPPFRAFGSLILTYLTRIASGYWNISDPQNGYTAISRDTLLKLHLDNIYNGFAFENDMLVKLNIIGARVIDVPHPALYRGQNSKINYPRFIVKTSWMLLRSWIWRLWVKYIKRAFH